MADVVQLPVGVDKLAKVIEEHGPVFGALKAAQVSLPLEDFVKLAMGERFAEVAAAIPSALAELPGIFSKMEKNAEEFLCENNYEPLDKPLSFKIKGLVRELISNSSLSKTAMQNKLTSFSLMGKKATIVKAASTSHPAGKVLAQEYARYKLAFLDGMDPITINLSLLQTL